MDETRKEEIMKRFAVVFSGLGLLLCGCGDTLSSEAQKAVAQIKLEASKAAVKTIDEVSTQAVAKLKALQGQPEKKDKPQETGNRGEEVAVQKK
jgi:hypothetical protein